MFRRLVRKYVREALHGPHNPQKATPVVDSLMNGQDHYATVVCIQNGYLLRLSYNTSTLGHMQNSIVYCRDEKEVSEQLSAHAVRARLNIPSSVKISPVSPVYTAPSP